jgi:NADH:ubiquinone oxidoreductase subunit 2 (subunit N)
MYFLAAGTDLITLFIGLELMALCFYVMVGFLRTDRRSNEAALKYLILGAFSSGFLVYGFSVMYGMSSACYSRSPRRRSICGRRTRTKARRPPSPHIFR